MTAEDHVRAWLSERGVPLELAVAASFRQPFRDELGAVVMAEVDHARYYISRDRDGRAEKVREADVVAQVRTGRWYGDEAWACVTWFVIECKAAKDPPWVLYRAAGSDPLSRNWRDRLMESLTVTMSGTEGLELDDWIAPETTGSLHFVGDWAYQLHITKRRGQSGRTDDETGAFDTIQQVLSAVEGVSGDVAVPTRGTLASIFVPVIVTAAPVYSIDTGSDPESLTLVEVTDAFPLLGRYRPDDRLRLIWIVPAQAVGEFAQRAARGSAAMRLKKIS